MSIIENLTKGLNDKVTNIGIGLGESEFHNNKILYAIVKFLNQIRQNTFIKITLFGQKEFINKILENSSYLKYKDNIILSASEEPEKQLINALDKFEINSAIRGSFKSSIFLNLLKKFSLESFGFKNHRGLIGALAAIGERLECDHTYELISYRKSINQGKKRRVDEKSIFLFLLSIVPSKMCK